MLKIEDEVDAYSTKQILRISTDPIHKCIASGHDLGVLEGLIDEGFEDDGSALVYSCLIDTFPFTRLLLEKFGDRAGYADYVDEIGRSPMILAVTKGKIKLVRLLLDFGASFKTDYGIYSLCFLGWFSESQLDDEELQRKFDAVKTMFLQFPAIRGSSWCWPMSERVVEKSTLKPRRIGNQFSGMLASMRRRSGRRPIIVVN